MAVYYVYAYEYYYDFYNEALLCGVVNINTRIQHNYVLSWTSNSPNEI